MPKTFKIGDYVRWNSEAGRVSGLIIKKITSEAKLKGCVHHASREAPQYLIGAEISVKITNPRQQWCLRWKYAHHLGQILRFIFISGRMSGWYILDGNFLFELNGNSLCRCWDMVFAPRGCRHTFTNIGTVRGRTLLTVVAGGFDMFF